MRVRYANEPPTIVVPAQKVPSTAKRRVSELGEASWERSRYTGERGRSTCVEPPGWSNGFLNRRSQVRVLPRGIRETQPNRDFSIRSRPIERAHEIESELW